jgi:hypothetical protein
MFSHMHFGTTQQTNTAVCFQLLLRSCNTVLRLTLLLTVLAGIDPEELEISIESGDDLEDEYDLAGELGDDDASLLDALEGSSSEYETEEDA